MTEITNNLIRFMFGGNCTFIVSDGQTNTAYKIFRKQPLPGEEKTIGVYQLYIKHGGKNIYCGYFKIKDNRMKFKFNNKYGIQETDERLTMLLDFIKLRDDYTPFHLYHTGRCAHCGRLLTDEKSIQRGFGPDCWKLINK